MIVANIISKDKIDVPNHINVVPSIEEAIDDLPTLILGYEYTNKLYPNYDLTKIEVVKDVYWTYKKTEKRDRFQKDLYWFESKVYSDLIKDVKYVFVDPIQYEKSVLRKIIKKICKLNDVVSYLNHDMLYVYGDNLIFGIDLKLVNYIGLDSEKVTEKVKRISKTFLDKYNLPETYSHVLDTLEDKIRFTPCLFSILNK